ncbi:hypothetical protein ND861_08690 [Leptospira sp. 2 VSF19]|uniref:Lipoprotein n=1 Tax=Leptospira soteropolitanensis TaxID=2950025 RepID=A0AAW5VD11_9LEPT|nr:hypothetical protein [Leptospira soteropolitanensis]MCW7492722.1 hypothetical protein [Leptospira soteropolitanensis]MCW7500405.1 hypothetical protein [Leptospira soteropolitanensis]MCW7522560.1 hypothetical protein [Leptospira soteropolitanensis]MCW7526416.1 hypothetical protein [Leptospira soteropolitanensis]MCW7530375.1 hypothetical protein [Leptospira soteropolitanensis]
MNRILLLALFFVFGFPLLADSSSKPVCLSLSDCETKADATTIHRKKITLLNFALSEYAKNAPIEKLLPLYLKRVRSIILEANGDTGYKGEIVLKVSHKPEYKQSQRLKAEDDLKFLESNQNYLTSAQTSELAELQTLFSESK